MTPQQFVGAGTGAYQTKYPNNDPPLEDDFWGNFIVSAAAGGVESLIEKTVVPVLTDIATDLLGQLTEQSENVQQASENSGIVFTSPDGGLPTGGVTGPGDGPGTGAAPIPALVPAGPGPWPRPQPQDQRPPRTDGICSSGLPHDGAALDGGRNAVAAGLS